MSTTDEQIPLWQIALLYIVVAFALYWRALGLSFFADDFSAVWRIGVQGDLSDHGFFRPLSELSIWANHFLFGTDPTGYRVTNVIIHWCNAMCVALLLRRTIEAKNDELHYAPIFAGLLFLCYPFHNEGVVWIVGRGASLATLCVLIGLIASLSSFTDRWQITWSTLAFFMGMLAYETVMIFPLIALPVLWLNGIRAKRLASFAAAWLGALVLHFFIRAWSIEQVANAYGVDFFSQPFTTYFRNVPKVFGRLFIPPNEDANALIVPTVLVGSILVLVVWTYVHRTRDVRAERISALAWSWMMIVACCVPVITSVSTRTSESDRFLYMASVFLCGLIALLLFRIAHGTLRWLLMATLLIASTWFLQKNNTNWIAASRTIASVIENTPQPENGVHIFIQGLPSDTCGAFVFRHGFHEALLMAGRDTTGLRQVDTIFTGAGVMPRMIVFSFAEPTDTVHVRAADRVVRWNTDHFDYLTLTDEGASSLP